jgi:hypothetical protein
MDASYLDDSDPAGRRDRARAVATAFGAKRSWKKSTLYTCKSSVQNQSSKIFSLLPRAFPEVSGALPLATRGPVPEGIVAAEGRFAARF